MFLRLGLVRLLLLLKFMSSGIAYYLTCRYRSKAEAACVKTAFGEDKYIEVGQYRMHYVEAGQGKPLVLIPGSFSTYRSWNKIMPYLVGRFRLLAVDYLGAGDSDKPASGFCYTIAEQADLIAAMIRKLGLGPVCLAGSSYGGVIVLNIAARYPQLVEKVICIEEGVVVPQTLPVSSLWPLLKYPVIGDVLIGLFKTGLLNRLMLKMVAGKWYPRMAHSEKKELLAEMSVNALKAHRIAWYWLNIAHKTCRDFPEEAKKMQAPVLYLYSEESEFSSMVEDNIKFFQEHLPVVRVVSLAGSIHNLQAQILQEVADLILDFTIGNESYGNNLGTQ